MAINPSLESATLMAAEDIDFFSGDILVNPYPTYRMLQDQAPVFWSKQLQSWVLTRYEDVHHALNEHGIFSSERTRRIVRGYVDRKLVKVPLGEILRPLFYLVAELKMGTFIELAENFMWQQDPPNHTRLRKLMHKGFTVSMVERQRDNIVNKVHRLFDNVAPERQMDFMADFAMKLPAMIVADIFGMPEDWLKLKQWEEDLKMFLGGSSGNQKKSQKRMLESIHEMKEHFSAAIQQRRKNPSDDLVSALVQAEHEGYYLNDLELCANLIVTLGAAQVTTQDMLGNGLLAMFEFPKQLVKMKDPAGDISNYIDELIRFDGPVQLTHRVLAKDLEIRGTQMKSGDLVYLIRGAANRDPRKFPNPDHLDFERETKGHVAFGSGIHYCIGAALARLEGSIAFRVLFDRFPNIRLDKNRPVKWRGDNLQFRGLASLPLLLN